MATPPTGAVIFLHGSGDTGDGLLDALRYSGFQSALAKEGFRLLCPTAASRPYSLYGGEPSTVWHDRFSLDPAGREDVQGIEESYQQILGTVTQLMEDGIVPNRIFVGGFSMGGGMALQFLARFRRPLAGAFAFSSFLANDSQVYSSLASPPSCSWPPILMCHGGADNLIPPRWGRDTAQRLHKCLSEHPSGKAASPPVMLYTNPGIDHELSGPALIRLLSWITSGGRVLTDRGVPLGETHNPIQSGIGYAVQPLGDGKAKVSFTVPAGSEPLIVQRPVMAGGGHFNLEMGEMEGNVTVVVESPTPEETAKAIAERIRGRLASNGDMEVVNICRPS